MSIRNILQAFSSILYKLNYYRWKNKWKFNILSTEDTISEIIKNRLSISRYGDGEFRIINNDCNGFQEKNQKLGLRLLEILHSNEPNHRVCLPHPLFSTKVMTKEASFFWETFIGKNKKMLWSCIPQNRTYLDTQFTRFYMDYKDKNGCNLIVKRIKEIWYNRNVYIIEGEHTKLGVGNDLLEGSLSVKRIICPAKNAFSSYEQILEKAQLYIPKEKDTLILCALGMTATVLAYDLYKLGYQCIDIGHIDIEYEWFQMHATEKCNVKNKAVNELGCNNPNATIKDKKYEESILYRITQ